MRSTLIDAVMQSVFYNTVGRIECRLISKSAFKNRVYGRLKIEWLNPFYLRQRIAIAEHANSSSVVAKYKTSYQRRITTIRQRLEWVEALIKV